MPKLSKWQAQHKGCQAAVDNVKADLTAEIDRQAARIMYLESLLGRAYPLLHNPYRKDDGSAFDYVLADEYDGVIRDVEAAIQHLPDEKLCGADDGSTVCTRDAGHPIPHHDAKTGRQWL